MHINAGGGNGAEIFYPNQNYRSDLGTTGHDLAQQILNKILELGIGEHGQGLKIRNSEDNTLYPDGSLADYLGVIRRSKLAGIPAILIEHAYIDTSDANYLNSDEKLRRFGVADATGIANYYGLSKIRQHRLLQAYVQKEQTCFGSTGVPMIHRDMKYTEAHVRMAGTRKWQP